MLNFINTLDDNLPDTIISKLIKEIDSLYNENLPRELNELSAIANLCAIDMDIETGYFRPYDDELYERLKESAPSISNKFIAARVYDALSICAETRKENRHYFEFKALASRKYRDSAQLAFQIEDDRSAFLFIESVLKRSLNLSVRQQKQFQEEFSLTVGLIQKRITDTHTKNKPTFSLDAVMHISSLMSALLEIKAGDIQANLEIINEIIGGFNYFLDNTQIEISEDIKYYLYIWKSNYLELKAKCLHLIGDHEGKITAFRESVLTRAIDMVDYCLNTKVIPHSNAVVETINAINLLTKDASRPLLLRGFGGFTIEAELLNKRLVVFQKKAREEPALTSTPGFENLNLYHKGLNEEEAKGLYEKGKFDAIGKNLEEVIAILLERKEFLPNREFLESLIEESEKIIPSIVVNQFGMYRAVVDPRVNWEEAISKLTYNKARSIQGLQSAYMLGLLQTVFEEFGKLEAPQEQLESRFIRPERREAYRIGIFNSDFATSLHILIPQVEDSLRYILEQIGIIDKNLADETIQSDFTLSNLLYNPSLSKPLEDFFGAEIMLNLKSLLVEKFGSNLRNHVEHGFLSDDHMYLALKECLYLNWIILKMSQVANEKIAVKVGQNISFIPEITAKLNPNDEDFEKGGNLLDLSSFDNTIVSLTKAISPQSSPAQNANLISGTIIAMLGSNQDGYLTIGKTLPLQDSKFIPIEHRALWFNGIERFLKGNVFEAAHFIIPQIEQSLRHILQENGEITAMLIDDVQDDFTLGKLITTYKVELGQLIGQDEINQLELLLVSDQYGLRNKLAHGLLDPQDFISDEMIYLLGLTLKICIDKISRIQKA